MKLSISGDRTQISLVNVTVIAEIASCCLFFLKQLEWLLIQFHFTCDIFKPLQLMYSTNCLVKHAVISLKLGLYSAVLGRPRQKVSNRGEILGRGSKTLVQRRNVRLRCTTTDRPMEMQQLIQA